MKVAVNDREGPPRLPAHSYRSGAAAARGRGQFERELAKIHAVSLITACYALAGLEREGIVSRRRGAGTVCGASKDPLQQADELSKSKPVIYVIELYRSERHSLLPVIRDTQSRLAGVKLNCSQK